MNNNNLIISDKEIIISDKEIVNNLISNNYDIKHLETKFIIYCLLLIIIQNKAFEAIFDNDNSFKIASYEGDEIKNNENDLLEIGETVKLLHPIKNQLIIEIKENRKIKKEEYKNIIEECMKEYNIKNDIKN